LPKVKAYRLSKEEFQKVVESFVTPKAKQEGYSEEQVKDAVKSGGITVSFPSEYLVLIVADSPEVEARVLLREVSRVAWKDWEQFAGDKWKEYTS
jgi:hypothetical protein